MLIDSIMFLLDPSAVVMVADNFDWIRDFNLRAEVDPSGFRERLATRFKIGDAQISDVLNNIEKPTDAYMVCLLKEMSGKPTDYIVGQYRSGKGKGWGVLAKSLGIKPGSKEFHALMRGNDCYADKDKDKGKDPGKGKGKNKGKGKANGAFAD
jgi:hypothetical protein